MLMNWKTFISVIVVLSVLGAVNAKSIYGDYKNIELTIDEQQGLVATLTVLLFILMAMDFTGPEVLFLIALMILCLSQVLTLELTLSGFSNESMITIGTLFLVIGAVEKSHIVDWMARKAFGTDGPIWFCKLRMYVTCFCLSIFFNNTPLVAILLPVVKDWGRMRGIAASQLLIPLSYSVLAGSFGSMIGTSTNLTLQGLMEDDRGFSFPFFAPLPIGIVCFVALLIYQIIAGQYLLPHHKSGLIREARDHIKDHIAEVFVSEHSYAINNSVSIVMSSLGVAPSNCIKIRRRGAKPAHRESEETKPDDRTISNKISIGVLDKKYLQDTAKFWFEKPNIPEKLSHSGKGDEESDGEDYYDIVAPSFHEVIQAGDVLFISSAQDAIEKMMKSIMGESRGLYILKGNVLSLPGYGSELVECVLSDTNPFLGLKVSQASEHFADRYKVGLITVRGKNWGVNTDESASSTDNDSSNNSSSAKENTNYALVSSENDTNLGSNKDGLREVELTNVNQETSSAEEQEQDHSLLHKNVSISDHTLHYGDTILVVTDKKNVDKLIKNREFFVVSTVGSLPKPLTLYTLIPVFVFVCMLVLVASELIEMCPAALTVTAFFFMGGWIKPKDIPEMVDIRLLMLMGTSLSFAKAMTTTGLAAKIAETINNSNPSNFGALMLIYVITLVITELISNNAAAALMYPLAVALADELGLSYKSFAMAVLVASTAGFMSPIGYQTHVMVWGPGGYSFRDFLIFGIVPDIIYWVLGCAIITVIYPL